MTYQLDPESARRRKLLLVVIDGLGAAPLRRAIADGHAPRLAELLDAGAEFDDVISPFPSLTPVCLSTIITGAGPDHHRIPSLSWYHRGQQRFVEYGSSFAATSVEGKKQMIEDVILNLNHVHLADEPHTLFEDFQDAGREAASINFLIWRGRTRHTMKHDYAPVRALAKRRKVHAVYGPDHLYFGELYGRGGPGGGPLLPQVGIKRPKDWSGAHIARWLMRNTGTEFTLLYLGEHDVASHKHGPDDTQRAIRVADRALGRVLDQAGGADAFLRDTALVVCADHGQVRITDAARIEDVFDDVDLFHGSRARPADDCDIAWSPSCRCAMAYRLGDHSPSARWIAERAQESPVADVVCFAEDGWLVARRGEAEVRARHLPGEDGDGVLYTVRARNGDERDRWQLEGDLEALDLEVDDDGTIHYGEYPDALERISAALRCINTGDVLVSAGGSLEFVDIGGSWHAGGSHGGLSRGDSVAPLITAGLAPGALPGLGTMRLSDVAGIVRSHARIEQPAAGKVQV